MIRLCYMTGVKSFCKYKEGFKSADFDLIKWKMEDFLGGPELFRRVFKGTGPFLKSESVRVQGLKTGATWQGTSGSL